MSDPIRTEIELDDTKTMLDLAYGQIDDLREDNHLLNQIMDLFDIQSAGDCPKCGEGCWRSAETGDVRCLKCGKLE
jgi:hypothetical protein